MNKKLLVTVAVLMLAVTLCFGTFCVAGAEHIDTDGVTHYGWSLICNETEKSCFTFGDDGNIDAIYAAEGDIANQRMNMYAIRDLAFDGDEEYTVQATFTPDAETDLSAERTYGIVAWYVDSDNYLIYWLQQKNVAPDWSGQFYGRVNGVFKKYVSTTTITAGNDYWFSGEYDDMWWDNAKVAHPALHGKRDVLITAKVTLKVVSKIETITVGGKEATCRSFELHQIVNDQDFVANKFYCKDVTSQSPAAKTGLYSEAFSFAVSDFSASGSKNQQKADAVATEINALGTIGSAEAINAVIKARVDFENLLELQSLLPAGTETKLETAEKAVGTYVDGLILALDSSSSIFKADVETVYNLYISLPENLAITVTETAKLQSAVTEANKPAVILSSVAVTPATVSLENGATEAQLKSAITVTATYSDSSTKEVTNYTISGIDYDSTSEQTVTVSYEEKGVTKTATVKVTIAKKPKKGCSGSISGIASIVGFVGAAAVVLFKKKR